MKMARDSYRYLALAHRERVHPPFNRRVLFPILFGKDEKVWQLWTRISIIALPLLVALYVFQSLGSWQSALFAAFLMAGMPSMVYWWETPVLVDAPALCFAVGAALLPWPYNLIVAAIGGLGRETVPIFAALYTLNPILLLGLIPVGIMAIVAPKGEDLLNRDEWLKHPIETAQKFKKGTWRSAKHFIYPWGAGLAALFYPSWQLGLTALIAYSQLFVATDYVRLYVWAAPVVLLQVGHIDPVYMIPLIIIHWFNPVRGEGT